MTEAMIFGLQHERTAVEQYIDRTGLTVDKTGLWTDRNAQFGASPDGLVSDGILEVKCLYSRRFRSDITWDACPPCYYAQVQGQLLICDAPWCDLVCWIPRKFIIIRVYRDETYLVDLQHALLAFADELHN